MNTTTTNTTNTATTLTAATPEQIADDIRQKLTPSEFGRSWSWRLTRPDELADSLELINEERERLRLALKVLEGKEVRDVFTRFGGKVINKRMWEALARACEVVAPVGESWTNFSGQKCQPCAKIAPGGAHDFAAIYIPGFESVTIYRRWSDYTPETRGDEYSPITGDRLDAAKACAILDYTAKLIHAKLDRIAADLERMPQIAAAYIRAAAMLEDACEGLTPEVRDAFGIGSRGTLPVYIHN